MDAQAQGTGVLIAYLPRRAGISLEVQLQEIRQRADDILAGHYWRVE